MLGSSSGLKLPLRILGKQTRSVRSSLPMPPPIARVVQVEVVSEYPNGHDVPLSSGSGGGGGPAPSVNPTEAEAAVQADRGPLPDKTNEAIRLKWQEIEVKPGGPLGDKVIVDHVEKEKIIKK